MIERDNRINLDVDKDRLKEIFSEALRIIEEYSGGSFLSPKENFTSKLDKILDSNSISTEFIIATPLDKIPDLRIRVDPRRKELLCKSSFKKKVAKLNHFITIL
jgi:hypothetical protein